MGYVNILEKAIIYIENNLGESLTVDDVANEVGYSYYHLTRIFHSVLGENIGNYINKRRLSNGANQLLYTDKKIIDIALENGFDSPEAFSRAFKKVYKVSPKVYRSNRLEVFLGNKLEINLDMLQHITSRMTVKPEIKSIEDIYVAGIRGHAKIDELFILWEQFGNIYDEIPDKKHPARTFGICEKIYESYELNYDMDFLEVIGVEVESFEEIPEYIATKKISSGKYAVFTHKGLLSDIIKTYQYIWGTWILLTDEVLDDREYFELYDTRFLGKDNIKSEMDIYIPIK